VDLAGTPPITSPEFWQRPERVEASADPDTATAQTIQIMCGHVKRASQDEFVRAMARSAQAQFARLSGVSAADAQSIAGAAFWWCKVFIKFVHHDFIIRQRLGETGHLQGLISPEVLVRMDKPQGDCAIFSECVAAFLTVFGIPFEFVTAAVNPKEPEIFSHVYLYAVLPDGSRLPLDASHGDYPGRQVPSVHVSRRQVWDADGNPVADRGSRFDGLHNYGMRGLGDVNLSGETGSDYGVIPDYTAPTSFVSATDIASLNPSAYQFTDASGLPYTGSALTVPAQNSAAWAGFANSLKGVLTLAEMYALKPGMVVQPNGTILQQNPGYAVGTPTGALNLGSGLSTSTLLIGEVVVGILFMSMGRK
jgi:hypothetical protein